jgi:hypothetical protein
MKKVWMIFLIGGLLALAYNMVMYLHPIKRNAFYSNEERAEGYVFDKHQYEVVTVGSSLSGAFEGRSLFDKNYFNLFMPHYGSCAGIEIIRRSNKIPKQLFVEINHIDRGIDSSVIKDVFENDFYKLKYYLPLLQTRNKFLTNFVDKFKKPTSSVNKQKPPAALFNKLLLSAREEWANEPNIASFDHQFDRLAQSLDLFAAKGCKIAFFEMPIDSSIRNSKLISYQRGRMMELAKQKGFNFIPSDTSRAYQTGDGIHLLQGDRDIYVKYLKHKIAELNNIHQIAKI